MGSHWSGNTGQRIGADVPDISERIIGGVTGGEDAEPHSAPWQVFLKGEAKLTETGRTSRNTCGGSIISKRHVLTAAHCVINEDNEPEKGISVIAGAHKTPID